MQCYQGQPFTCTHTHKHSQKSWKGTRKMWKVLSKKFNNKFCRDQMNGNIKALGVEYICRRARFSPT